MTRNIMGLYKIFIYSKIPVSSPGGAAAVVYTDTIDDTHP